MALAEKFRRLSKMDLPEIRFRAAQQFRLTRERWSLRANGHAGSIAWGQKWDPAKVSDHGLAEALAGSSGDEAEALLPSYFAGRTAPRFFFTVPERAAIAELYPRLFAVRAGEIRAAADALCAHRLKIFAYPEVDTGPRIPWRRDLVHGIESGNQHGSHIPYLDFASAGDSKIVWEPNRHQHFFTLGQAWILTGDARYAEECFAQIDDWLRANPYPRGINWASSLEAAFRAWSWLWAVNLFSGSPALTGARLGALSASFAQHAEFIAANLSTYFSPNTHLLGEGFSLFAIGLLLPELRGAAAWRDAGRAILLEEMQHQVRTDGAHIEQSASYHRYALEFFLCAALLAERNGCAFPASYHERLDRMLEFSRASMLPSGLQPMTGDADGGQLLHLAPRTPHDHRPLLSIAAAWRGDPDLARAAGRLSEEALWLLGPSATKRFAACAAFVAGEESCEPSSVFPASGAVVQRAGSGARARYLFFDAGPQGMDPCAHGHADALQIVCSADGVDWLIDPGTFVYTSSREWRDFFRSTSAHSTVTVDRHDQAEPVDFFKWSEIPQVRPEGSWMLSGLDAAVASHTGYARLPGCGVHRRAVIFVKPHYWLVADTLEGSGTHALDFFFHFAPDVALTPQEGGAMAVKGAERFLIQAGTAGAALRVVEGADSPRQGWFSEDYGHRVAAPVLAAEMKTALPARALWLLWPSPVGEVKIRSLDAPGARGVQAAIETSAWTDHVSLRASEDTADGRGLSTDADLAFVRHDAGGRLIRLALAGGCCADFAGQELLRAANWLDRFEAARVGDLLEVQVWPPRPLRLRWPGAARLRVNNRDVAAKQRGDWFDIPGDS